MSEPKSPQELVDGLVRLLTVTDNGDDNYTGNPQKDGIGRVFGGQVIAQALMAAETSVPDDKEAHSLHAYFLRGGKEGPPIDYQISRDFEGRSFANRRVVASQTDADGVTKPILNMTASFQKPEEGLEHNDYEMPDVAPPENLKSDMELRREMIEQQTNMPEQARRMMLRPRPIEMRTIDRLHWMNTEKKEPKAHSWLKAEASR